MEIPVCLLWYYYPVFTITGLLDIIIAVLYSRFYSTAAFIVSFGAGSIVGFVFCYAKAVEIAAVKK